jgi:hypothetical protein
MIRDRNSLGQAQPFSQGKNCASALLQGHKLWKSPGKGLGAHVFLQSFNNYQIIPGSFGALLP